MSTNGMAKDTNILIGFIKKLYSHTYLQYVFIPCRNSFDIPLLLLIISYTFTMPAVHLNGSSHER